MPTPRKNKKSVAIVDDHALFRNGISALIEKMNDDREISFDILFEAENGEDFIEKLLIQTFPLDIVILDIQMPIMGGLETLKWINSHNSRIKVLILSMHNDPDTVATFMKEGAAGYLTKIVSPQKIQSALKQIALHGYFYDDFVTTSLITTLKKIDYNPHTNFNQGQAILATRIITQREKEFLKLLATELSYKEIAEKMKISPRTVDGYREELFRKVGVNSRVGLVMYSLREGILNE